MSYILRPLESHDDYKACERLQRHAWGFADDIDIIPQTNLVTVQKWGGLVLGAFDENGELHGFCYGFLGRDPSNGRLVHCSHMLAVDERARNAGLGTRLKWAQRDYVREQGIDVMVWTYDPLESVNACLNFAKLGGLSDDYQVNLYGETTSKLHSGTPTDRLTLTWIVGSPRVAQRAEGRRGEVFRALAAGDIDAPWALRADGWGPGEPALDLDAQRVRCQIPVSVQEVKDHDRGAAAAWRDATRAVFTGYFDRGYFTRECVHAPGGDTGGEAKTVYLFEHGDLETDGTKE
jgi:predicted GNAT superfamily acetyltransferase